MGIFDDAIREHLELKRQHGADEPELRKLEDEAFGPPARPGQAEAADASLAEASASGDETAAAVAEPPPPAPMPQDIIEGPGEAPTELVEVEEEVAEMPADPDDEVAETPPDSEDEAVAEPASEEHPAMEHRTVDPGNEQTEETPLVEQPTELHEYEEEESEETAEDEFFSEQSLSDELDQALDAPGSSAPPAESREPSDQGSGQEAEPEEGEDVLEETPEFLQDTPEHDRLWFEQKPPKDFDFDD
jgi:hypothetical protein